MDGDIVNSIAVYILNNDISDLSDIDIYNRWAEKNNIIIKDVSDVLWITEFINNIKKVELNYIKEALNIKNDGEGNIPI